MISLNLITHCYSPSSLPTYHKMLAVQLSSLIYDCQPRFPVRVYVACDRDDELTCGVVSAYAEAARRIEPSVQIHRHAMVRACLFRRAIGRQFLTNVVDQWPGQETKIVHYADCDYFYTQPAIEAIAAGGLPPLFYPARYYIHRDHDTGDALVDRLGDCHDGEQIFVDHREFVLRDQKIAIGGMQFRNLSKAPGGYVPSPSRWTVPANETSGFTSCRCDKAHRAHMSDTLGLEISAHPLLPIRSDIT